MQNTGAKIQKEKLCFNLKSLAKNVKPRAINLDVFFNANLNFTSEVAKKSTFYHLRNIADVQLSLSWADTGGIKHSFFSSRPDYCKAPFFLSANETFQCIVGP